jgi:hypothetical protein
MLRLSDFHVNECDEGLDQDDGDADEGVDDEVGHDHRKHHDPGWRTLEENKLRRHLFFSYWYQTEQWFSTAHADGSPSYTMNLPV